MGHKSHHHSKEKDRGRNKHRHHKSHSRRSSSQSSDSSSSSYSSSDSYSHHSHKKRKHHHRHHKEKEKSKKIEVSKDKKIDKDSPSINKIENEKKLVGTSLPSDFNNIPKKEEIKNDSTNNDNEKKFVGPVLPSFLQNKDNESSDEDSNESNNDSSALIGPSLPSSFNNENIEQNKKVVGPSLPPSFNNESTEQKKRVVGPTLPPSVPNVEIKKVEEESESDDDIIGPLPIAPGQELTEEEETQRIIREFEERADRMKRKLEGKDEPEKPKKLVRDEWMTTLPEDNILDRINVMKPRQFRKNGITKIDRSGWTDTPADKLRKQKEGIKDKEEKVEYIQINKKDQEMERMVEQYNREHRNESLYDQHAKEYFKNKKYEENDISKLPFNRERDVLGAGSKGSIGKTNALKGVLGTESANRFTHSTTKRFL